MLSKQTLRAKLWENVRDEIGIKMEEQGKAGSSKRINNALRFRKSTQQ